MNTKIIRKDTSNTESSLTLEALYHSTEIHEDHILDTQLDNTIERTVLRKL